MITTYHAKIGSTFHSLRRSGDWLRPALSIGSHLKPIALNSLGTANIISRSFFGNSCRSSLPDSRVGDFSKRFFSQVPPVTNKVENVGAQDVTRHGNKHWFKMMISKRKKLKKALAAQSETEATVSSISKDADIKVSNEKQVGIEKEDEKLGSSISNSSVSNTNEVSKPKGKKKSKSKKTKEQDSAANAITEAALTPSSEGTSQTKKSGRIRKGAKSSQDSEVSVF